ncbi:hypothetical protein GCM10023317_28600 [Actinopolymorpha pittospori]
MLHESGTFISAAERWASIPGASNACPTATSTYWDLMTPIIHGRPLLVQSSDS